MMIMMILNPLMKWPPQWLTEKQVAVAEMHFERRYRAAKRALGQDDHSVSLLSYSMRQFDSPVMEGRF